MVEVLVADPSPNPRMLKLLTEIAPEVHIMPPGPFGATLAVP
jgi:hypothetical protein